MRRARTAGEKEEGGVRERGPGARGTSPLATTLFGLNGHNLQATNVPVCDVYHHLGVVDGAGTGVGGGGDSGGVVAGNARVGPDLGAGVGTTSRLPGEGHTFQYACLIGLTLPQGSGC